MAIQNTVVVERDMLRARTLGGSEGLGQCIRPVHLKLQKQLVIVPVIVPVIVSI